MHFCLILTLAGLCNKNTGFNEVHENGELHGQPGCFYHTASPCTVLVQAALWEGGGGMLSQESHTQKLYISGKMYVTGAHFNLIHYISTV